MSNLATTRREKKANLGPYGKLGHALGELDDRLGVAKGGRTFLDKIFPDHWSFMLGEIALYSFVILLATGVFLTLYYVPSQALVTYHGSYLPLDGQRVTQAFASTVDLSFKVRAGLLMRQMHHWACDIFVGAIVVHMARVFFTGAFRKPRELNWTIGTTLLILAIVNGFLGYSLPDDLVSGTGIRIAYSIILSVPVVGTYLGFWVFGGNFPGTAIIPRFFILHVLIVPAIIVTLVTVHMVLLVRQKHTQFPGEGRTEKNVVGAPMFPVFMAKTTGFLFIVSGFTALLGAFAQINPIWQFGPYDAARISYAVQPDWYMGFLDGALRIFPAWSFHSFGHTIPLEVTIPAVILPGLIFNLVFAWPALERKFTGDHEMHNLLDRPINRPKRTAAGAAVFALLAILFIASSTDVIANFFHLSLNTVLWAMRFLTFIVPIVTYPVTYKICKELQGVANAGKRKTANVVTRTSDGEYQATPSPAYVDDVSHELEPTPVPAFITPSEVASDERGVRTVDR
ncbi:MAG: ubiquinol-cytochrome c reductase cytochrome b subunit [Acidobacteriota bacterium]|nr:ubiquinol-cytochrome c reductase cytochrome b subunit [Acidobacteriota bacterium]MDE3043245.1 ubiquinol-cytochrome c reductase cytochrome b subunit [Acidobacteriota bacterium]MDE3106567.1 ubiquinol-cytochrome c reductase cytochrome b subunit [Acidobacteriota bacterium]MDE3222196.1 ubiquinol-cytochrome c reductase cytochrome b subunit [Acidobacteriota bacterium]